MKKTIKKVAATTLSVLGILSTMPSALCAPHGEDASSKNTGKDYSAETNCAEKGKLKNFTHMTSKNKGNLFYFPYSFAIKVRRPLSALGASLV